MDIEPGSGVQLSFLEIDLMRANNTENSIKMNQSRSVKQSYSSMDPRTKHKDNLINRKEPCFKQLKETPQSQPPSHNPEELHHATID